MKRDILYLAKYKQGLMNDTVLHLAEGDDPVKMALAEYRRCSGEVNLLSKLTADEVVASVELIAAKS